MPILAHRIPQLYLAALKKLAPSIEVIKTEEKAPDDLRFMLVMNELPDEMHRFKQLEVVQSIAAGVEHLVSGDRLPTFARVARVASSRQAEAMSEYVALHVLRRHRQLDQWQDDHQRGRWVWRYGPRASEVTVGIMGMGRLGQSVAARLQALGYVVRGWSREAKPSIGIEHFAGNGELGAFLSRCNHLVCLLPLTNETRGILNRELFQQLPDGAHLINVGRGQHLVEADLIEALDLRKLSAATLDVLAEEPATADHPFWGRSEILITSHSAAPVVPADVAPQILENYRRVKAGETPLNLVDIERGY